MEKYDVKFKKKLGQNFLKDESIVKNIVDVSSIDKDSLVIEVGPGGAIMTKELARRAGMVFAYEVDTDFEVTLNKELALFNNVSVLFKDFLEADLKRDIAKYNFSKLFFVSNVPYYITTPIILKLLDSGLHFEKIVMMVQKEVGDRLASSCGTKDYGSITVLLNYFYDIKEEFLVLREEFVPIPNVDSVVISFTEKKDKLFVKDFKYFEKLVRDSFQYKRKNIKNNLKNYNLNIVEAVLKKYDFDLTVRAEALDMKIFVELANSLVE